MKKIEYVALLIIFISASFLFYFTTDGFTAFTIEQQRIQDLKEQKPKIHNVQVTDHLGESYQFSDFNKQYKLITFIYTSCSTACPQMETNMQRVYDQMDMTKHKDELIFMSITFDRERDTVDVLNKYATYFDADGTTWKMLRTKSEDGLQQLLDQYGVTVIPDGDADFQHNTSFYLIAPDGTLEEVLNFKDVEGTVDTLEAVLRKGGTS